MTLILVETNGYLKPESKLLVITISLLVDFDRFHSQILESYLVR